MSAHGDLGFAPEDDAPIPYIQRIRDYYLALGYPTPYRWAHYAEAPFQPLEKPLAQCRVALITTAAPYRPSKGDQGPGAPYNAAAKFYAVYLERVRSIMMCGSPISPLIARTPPAKTRRPGFRWRNCGAAPRSAGSEKLRRASTACRRTAATAPPSKKTAPNFWRAAVRIGSTPPSSSPTDRCAIRP
jgi:hypothetical protein